MYCYHCMNKIKDDAINCEICGKEIAIPEDELLNHLHPGTIINEKYMVGAVIGEGGFGITYIGIDTKLEMKIAIKEYFPNGYASRNAQVTSEVSVLKNNEAEENYKKGKDKFLLEARTLAKFSHNQNIVNVRDFFELNNTAYIVMDFLEGDTLKKYIKDKGVLKAEEFIRWISPMLKALGEVHAAGLIHRDISPDNIIVEHDRPILIDFGAARNVESQKSLSVILKPGYAPMEQYYSNGKQGPWTDVYAMSATIYSCITGVVPPEASERTFKDEIKTPTELGIEVSERIENALMKGLSLKYEERQQDMYELLIDLVDEQEAEKLRTIAKKPLMEDDISTVMMSSQSPVQNKKSAGKSEGKASGKTSGAKEKSGINKKIIAIGVAVMAIIACCVVFLMPKGGENTSSDEVSAVKVSQNDVKEAPESDSEDLAASADAFIAAHAETGTETAYLIYNDGTEKAVIDEALTVIKERLGRLYGEGEYCVAEYDDHAEVIVPMDKYENLSTIDVLKKNVFSGGGISILHNIYGDLKIEPEDIQSADVINLYDSLPEDIQAQKDEEECYGVKIVLSEAKCKELRSKAGEWENSDDAECSFGSVVYEDLDSEDESEGENKSGQQELSLYVCSDFERYKNGIIENDTYFYNYEVVNNNGYYELVLYGWSEGQEKNCELFTDLLMNSKQVDMPFEVTYTAPAAWDDPENPREGFEIGKGQKRADYFEEEKIKALDVIYQCGSEYGDFVDGRNSMVRVLDELNFEYALGQSEDYGNNKQLVVRVAAEGKSKALLQFDKSLEVIPCSNEENSEFALTNYSSISIKPSDVEDIYYQNGQVVVAGIADMAGNNEDSGGIPKLDLTGVDRYTNLAIDGLKLYCNLGDNYLFGHIEDGNLIFDKSTYAEDGSVPKAFETYISMIKGMENLYLVYYREYYPCLRSCSDVKEEVQFGLTNKMNAIIEQNVISNLTNMTGMAPEVTVSLCGDTHGMTTITGEYKQDITEQSAENVFRIADQILDAQIVSEEYKSYIPNAMVYNLAFNNSDNKRVFFITKDMNAEYGEGLSTAGYKEELRIVANTCIAGDKKELLKAETVELRDLFDKDKKYKDWNRGGIIDYVLVIKYAEGIMRRSE